MNVCFISCVKSKRPFACTAKNLYTSDLFKKSLHYALSHYDKTYILSAKYQLVDLEQIIEPYELTLNTMPKKLIKIWSAQTAQQIKAATNKDDQFFFIAGQNYCEQLIPMLPNKCTVLFKGLGLGKRLQAMK